MPLMETLREIKDLKMCSLKEDIPTVVAKRNTNLKAEMAKEGEVTQDNNPVLVINSINNSQTKIRPEVSLTKILNPMATEVVKTSSKLGVRGPRVDS